MPEPLCDHVDKDVSRKMAHVIRFFQLSNVSLHAQNDQGARTVKMNCLNLNTIATSYLLHIIFYPNKYLASAHVCDLQSERRRTFFGTVFD